MSAAPVLEVEQRKALAAVAEVLIPGGEGMPSARAADVSKKWVDRVLEVRPDLYEPLVSGLSMLGDRDTAVELEGLRTGNRDVFNTLTLVVAGAYFLNPRVKKAMHYPGPKRTPALQDEAELYLEDGILDRVIGRGPIYRPTPTGGQEASSGI